MKAHTHVKEEFGIFADFRAKIHLFGHMTEQDNQTDSRSGVHTDEKSLDMP